MRRRFHEGALPFKAERIRHGRHFCVNFRRTPLRRVLELTHSLLDSHGFCRPIGFYPNGAHACNDHRQASPKISVGNTFLVLAATATATNPAGRR